VRRTPAPALSGARAAGLPPREAVGSLLALAWAGWAVLRHWRTFVDLPGVRSALGTAAGGPYDWSAAGETWRLNAAGAAAAAAVLAVAVGWGAAGAGWLRLRGAGTRAAGLGLGLLALGLASLGLGLLGFLQPGVLACLVLPAWPAWRRAFAGRRGARAAVTGDAPRRPAAGGGRERPARAGAAALAPELGWDALTYHLRAPSHWLAADRIVALPFSLGSFYPFLADQWFLLAMAFGGEPGARLLNWAFLPLTALALAGVGTRLVGPVAGPLAALLFVSQGPALAMASQCYNDLETATLALLAVAAALRLGAGWRLASALLCGAVLGCKMTGAFVLVACAVLWVARDRRRPGLRAAGAAAAAAAGILACSPWPLKNWLWTGNPVYPMAPGLFPASGWNPYVSAADAARIVPVSAPAGPAVLLGALLRFPAEFSAGLGAVGVGYGALPVALLPALLLPGPRRSAPLAFAGVMFAALWVAAQAGDGRYLLPVAALLAVPAAEGAARLARARWLAPVVSALVAAGAAAPVVQWTGYVSRMYAPWRVAVGAEPRPVYRGRAMLPHHEYAPMTAVVEAATPRDARILVASDIVTYPCNRWMVFDTQQVMPPVATRLVRDCREPRALRKRFRQLGIGWVLHTSRAIALERECRCLAPPEAARDCVRAFWRRYAEPAAAYGTLTLLRLRSERLASASPPPFIVFPGVQDEAFTAAEEARYAGDLARAEAVLADLVRREPELAAARFKLAEVRLLRGDVRGARAEADRAARLGLEGAPLDLLQAGLLAREGREAEALERAAAGAARWPAPRPLALYGVLLWNAGRKHEARAALAEARRLDPFDAEVRRVAGQMREGS
jgi:hypothetical protein